MGFVNLQEREGMYNIPYFPNDTELAHRICVPLNALGSEKEVHTLKDKMRKMCEATGKQWKNIIAQVHVHK